MTQTTIETISTQQVRDLRAEAAEAGDTEQVEICTRALRALSRPGYGHHEDPDVLDCVAAIRSAEAQAV